MENQEKIFLSTIDKIYHDIKLPNMIEKINKPWVYYGEDNLYPLELIALYNNSPLNKSIIDSKTNMMVGSGLKQEDIESPRTQVFIDQVNPYETLDDVFKFLSFDFLLYGLCYIDIVWSKDRQSIAELYRVDASKIRWGKLDEKSNLTHFYYSRDWHNYRKERYKPIEVPVFNPDKKGKEPRQLLPIFIKSPGMNYYSLPSWRGGIVAVETDIEISNFHLNNLLNGMNPSLFMSLPYTPIEKERQIIQSKIDRKYKGTGNAGKAILAFYDAEGTNKPEAKVLQSNNLDKMFDLLDKRTQQKILMAHEIVNENLVGISTPGKLGGANELLNAHELFYNTIIKPDQDIILRVINKITQINGMNKLYIQRNKPMDYKLSEDILLDIMTKKEMRVMIGENPEPDEDMIDEKIDIIEPKNNDEE